MEVGLAFKTQTSTSALIRFIPYKLDDDYVRVPTKNIQGIFQS